MARVISLLCFLAWGLCSGHAQDSVEYRVKAAYLYNFVKLTTWPEHSLHNDSSALVIGVVGGDDEFVDVLKKTLAGKTVAAHSLTVKRADSIADMDACHLVFFRSSAGHKRTQAATSALATANILLVGEDEAFLREGGMINLVLKNGKVRFEIVHATLDAAELHLSSELLALAISPGGGGSSESAAAEPRRLKIGPPPEYPEIAKKMNLRGVVQVEATVRRDGTVEQVRVIGGHPVLADALVKAVMQWRYAPAPEESQVVVKFEFGQ